MTTVHSGIAHQRIQRAGQLLSAAHEQAMQAWTADPTSPWLIKANALMTAREALAHFESPKQSDTPIGEGDPLDLAHRARDELEAIPGDVEPSGFSVLLVYLADAIRDLEAGS